MKTRWRIVVAASAVLMTASAPALAQDTAAPARNDVVGPPQLQNFSLEGTVTRAAPAPAQVEPPARQGTAQSGGSQDGRPSSSPPPQASRASTANTARNESPTREQPVRSAAAAEIPAPAPARETASTQPAETDAAAMLSPQPASVPARADPVLQGSPGEVPMLPWLIAALALAGAAAWYFLRQRPRERYATAGGIELFEAPQPDTTPASAPPVRTPPAAVPKPVSSGIVSTRLRPWLEIEFKPQRAIVDEDKAAIELQLSIFNSGSAPARDVLVEASMFNAGPMQDQEIRRFFESPLGKNPIRVIAPLERITVNTAVVLPLEQVRPIELEGRPLFVPMVAFNLRYGWGGGAGQSSASYLVGKTTKTDKLAPFRLDLGPRVFRSLDSREHALRLRN